MALDDQRIPLVWNRQEDRIEWRHPSQGWIPVDGRGMRIRRSHLTLSVQRTVITATGYTTVALPDDCSRVSITCIGAGSGGDGGTTGDNSAQRLGGSGGASGAWSHGIWHRLQLPSTLYCFVGTGGSGAAAGGTGTAGGESIVEPSNTGFTGTGSPPALLIAGASEASTLWARCALTYEVITAIAGQTATGSPGNATPWAGNSSNLLGGRAGGSKNAVPTATAGGGWSALGGIAARAGGTAPGGAGLAGIYGGGSSGYATAAGTPSELAWAYGGTGGGAHTAGTGGVGGNGAIGCGGGGGGAGTAAGGAGGNGGNGCIIIECW
jgi:hypothetical protein